MDINSRLQEAETISTNIARKSLANAIQTVDQEYNQPGYAFKNPQLVNAVLSAQTTLLNTLITKALNDK